ncbi:hypothetical protein GCM10009872_08830 [Actinopolymorpha rutila]
MAHAIPFLVLPSGLWRLAAAFGFPMGQLDASGHPWVSHGWSSVYIALISVLSEVVALTAFGLVQPLGNEIPQWVPHFGGRGVHPKAVFFVAALGSMALVLIWTVGFWRVWTGHGPGSMTSGPWTAVFTACYAPLNLWGPSLLVLAWAYRRRAAASLV